MLGIRARKNRGNKTTLKQNRKAPRISALLGGSLSAAIAATLCIVAPAQANYQYVPADQLRLGHTSKNISLQCGYSQTDIGKVEWTTQEKINGEWKLKKFATEYNIAFENTTPAPGKSTADLSGFAINQNTYDSWLALISKEGEYYKQSHSLPVNLPVGTHKYSISQSARRATSDMSNPLVELGAGQWAGPATGNITVAPTTVYNFTEPLLITTSNNHKLTFSGVPAQYAIDLTINGVAQSKTATSAGKLDFTIPLVTHDQEIKWVVRPPNSCSVVSGLRTDRLVVPGDRSLIDDTEMFAWHNPPSGQGQAPSTVKLGEAIHVTYAVLKTTSRTPAPIQGQVSVVDQNGRVIQYLPVVTQGTGATFVPDTAGPLTFHLVFRSWSNQLAHSESAKFSVTVQAAQPKIEILTGAAANDTYVVGQPLRVRMSGVANQPTKGTLTLSNSQGNVAATVAIDKSGEYFLPASVLNQAGAYSLTFTSADNRYTNATKSFALSVHPAQTTTQLDFEMKNGTVAYEANAAVDYTISGIGAGGVPRGNLYWQTGNSGVLQGPVATSSSGSGTLTIGKFPLGEHEVSLFFEPSNPTVWPGSVSGKRTFSVVPASTRIEILRNSRYTEAQDPVIVEVKSGNQVLRPPGEITVYREGIAIGTDPIANGSVGLDASYFKQAGNYTFSFKSSSENYKDTSVENSPQLVVSDPSLSFTPYLSATSAAYGEIIRLDLGLQSSYADTHLGKFVLTYPGGTREISATDTNWSRTNLPYLEVGTHSLEVQYIGVNDVPSSEKVLLSITVTKFKPVLSLRTPIIDSSDAFSFDLLTQVYYESNNQPTGQLTITRPDGTTMTVPAARNTSLPAQTFTAAGNYTISYPGDDNYEAADPTSFAVTHKPTLTIPDLAVQYGTEAAIKVSGLEESGLVQTGEGTVTTEVRRASGSVAASATSSITEFAANGFRHMYPDLELDRFEVRATYNRPRGNFSATSSPTYFDVSRAKTTLNPSEGSFQNGWEIKDGISIEVVSSTGSTPTGTVSLSSELLPEPLTIPVTDGIARISTGLLTKAGSYSVMYNGDTSHSASALASFSMRLTPTQVNATWNAHHHTQANTVRVSGLPSDATGTATVVFTSSTGTETTFSSSATGGQATIEIPANSLELGTYSVRVSYSGDSRNAASSKAFTGKYSVERGSVALTAQWNNSNLSIALKSANSVPALSSNGKVVWTLLDANNKQVRNGSIPWTGPSTSTSATLPLTGLAAGKYTLRAQLSTTETNLQSKPLVFAFTVTSKVVAPTKPTPSKPTPVAKKTSKTTSKLKKTSLKYGSKGSVVVAVTASNISPTGKIEIYSGTKRVGSGKLKATAKGKSTAIVTISKLSAGRHKLSVRYLGDSKVKASTVKTSTIRVSKQSAKIKTTIKSKGRSVTVKVSGKVRPSGKVTLKVGGKKYTKALKKGKVTFKVAKLKKGKTKFVVSYSGSKNTAKASKTSKYTVR